MRGEDPKPERIVAAFADILATSVCNRRRRWRSVSDQGMTGKKEEKRHAPLPLSESDPSSSISPHPLPHLPCAYRHPPVTTVQHITRSAFPLLTGIQPHKQRKNATHTFSARLDTSSATNCLVLASFPLAPDRRSARSLASFNASRAFVRRSRESACCILSGEPDSTAERMTGNEHVARSLRIV